MSQRICSEAWFIADTHLNHFNIIQYCGRPFSSIEEMNETIITNWNAKAKEEDIIYHLGDFIWGRQWQPILERLKGRIVLIRGGHDKKQANQNKQYFLDIRDFLEITIDHEHVVLCHYCMRIWPRSHYNSIHLFGHSHNRLEAIGKSLDVGVDGHNFHLWSWPEIKEYMSKRPHNPNYVGLTCSGRGL